jgi:hypothetical protein
MGEARELKARLAQERSCVPVLVIRFALHSKLPLKSTFTILDT